MACQNVGEIVLSRAFGVGTDAGVLLLESPLAIDVASVRNLHSSKDHIL